MSDTILWCLFEATCFCVRTSPTTYIADLKSLIKKTLENTFRRVDASDLNLWKVDVDLVGVREAIYKGKYQFKPTRDQRPLGDMRTISYTWPQLPPHGQLHVYITLPAKMRRPTLTGTTGEQIGHVNDLKDYKDILIKVKNWRTFEQSDITRNQIRSTEELMEIPGFVKLFEQKLVRKPRLHPDMHAVLQIYDIPGSYFELPENPITGDESLEETRYVERLELLHIASVALYNWEKGWQPVWGNNCPLRGQMADAIFFYHLVRTPNDSESPAAVLLDKSCPITVVVKRDGGKPDEDKEPRKYNPRSDFLISHSSLPRLLVEVNSTSGNPSPVELIRMLTTGAFIVRFANRFLTAFHNKRNFVLCAIFIWDSGKATRYSLFQQEQQIQDDDAVYYKEEMLSLNDSAGRIYFLRQLYNLLRLELYQDQETRAVILDHNRRIDRQLKKSMHTKNDDTGGKRTRTGSATDSGNRAGEGGGDDHAQLRAHGYELKPGVDVDASGNEWAPLFKRPDHILTVYRPMDSNKEFIAKKVREDSHELKILRLLDTFPLKSDHVISLIDSFHGWAILPKMVTVENYVEFAPDRFERKVSQVCWGLIKGLAYLHEHHIAHRDIKPDNLLLNENFCLKIIDFDIAMQVKDEDEEVDGQCGTKNWMTPEVEKNLRHSPIKADRWACGRVLLFLLDTFGKEDESLRGFARNLMAYNPNQRPSLFEIV